MIRPKEMKQPPGVLALLVADYDEASDRRWTDRVLAACFAPSSVMLSASRNRYSAASVME